MHESNHSADALLARARSGDVRALTALGKRMLVGQGAKFDTPQALTLLREAASRNDGEATALLGVCAAWGIGQARDIHAAIDCLQRAAHLGWESARRELELLRRRGKGTSQIQHEVDLSAWTTPPPGQILRDKPRLIVFKQFASDDECRWLIERGRPQMTRAKVYRDSAEARFADTRTNREASLTIFNADLALSLMRDRIAAAALVSSTHFEVAKILHYAPGEQFALHADFIEPSTPDLIRQIATLGQRAATFLLYLNDDYAGGATEFPRLALRHRGARGDALLFSNIDAAGEPDYDTIHAGLPTTEGEKWVLSQWIRTRSLAAASTG
jgi:TPR repeat protein